MGKIISIVNQKGGVGKTTTTVNLGASLAELGKKVLLFDFDEQANCTLSLGIKTEDILYDTADFFSNIGLLKRAVIDTGVNNLFIIPASIKLASIEESIYSTPNNQLLLKGKLDQLKDEFDFILIDCPPSLGLIVENALYASDSVIIPSECGVYSCNALTQMINKINQVQKTHKIKIDGILVTKFDNRTTTCYTILDQIKFLFPKKIFKTTISFSSHVQQAPAYGKSVLEFSPNSRGSKEYKALALEVVGLN